MTSLLSLQCQPFTHGKMRAFFINLPFFCFAGKFFHPEILQLVSLINTERKKRIAAASHPHSWGVLKCCSHNKYFCLYYGLYSFSSNITDSAGRCFFPVHSLRRIPGPLREEQIVETQRSAQSRSEVVSGNKELVYLELGFSFFLNQLLINTVSVTNRFSIREIQVHLTISWLQSDLFM